MTLLVAASAREAVEEAVSLFSQETEIAVKISPGPSNALAAQIIEGAPGDVFLSASPEWAAAVLEKGLSLEMQPLFMNDLVLVVPKGNPAGLTEPKDVLSASVNKVALAGENVPAGKYAEQALKALKLYDQLAAQKKIVRGQDVRGTLTYVELGEADAGVVYWTDAKASKAVEVVSALDPATFERIVYHLVLLKSAEGREAPKRLFDFLRSASAEKLFKKHGFAPLR